MIVARHAVRRRRRGAILLVVLALLALFAVIGLSFVLYAESEATASRVYREAVNNRDRQLPNPDPSGAIGQIVFGASDPQSGFNGVDLARLMYGFDPSSGNDIAYNGIGLVHETLTLPASNGTATGTLTINRAEVINFAATRLGPVVDATGAAVPAPAELFKIDAEHSRGDGNVRRTSGLNPLADNSLAQMIFIPKNAPYTYPDRNNALVAAVDPVSGRVIVPSGHRPSLFNLNQSPAVGASPSNVNWYSGAGRFRTLRPRPIDHVKAADMTTMIAALNGAVTPASWPLPDGAVTPANVAAVNAIVAKYTQFPYPTPNPDGSTTGDVQNLKYAQGPQRNDSFWVDARLPTQDYKGRKVALLVAPLLVPLNGRLDLNAVASLVGGQHRSADGFGPHEINPAWLSALATTAPLPGGATGPAQSNFNQLTQARFGGGTTTPNPPSIPTGTAAKPFHPVVVGSATQNLPAPSYAPVPWDTAAAGPPDYSATINPANLNKSAPDYSGTGYGTAALDPASGASHPTLWNQYVRGAFTTTDGNPTNPATDVRAFPLTDLRLFAAKYSGKATDYQNQTFLANDRRMPPLPSPPNPPQFTAFQNEFLGNGTAFLNSLGSGPGSPGNQTRSLVTTLSGGFARPGLGANFGMDSTRTVANPAPSFQLAAGSTTPALAVTDISTGSPVTTPTWPLVQINTNVAPVGPVPTINHLGGVTVGDPPADPPFNQNRFAERAFTDSLPLDGTLASNTFKRLAQNLRAGLGGVDLNRPLADYRLDLTRPLTGPLVTQPANAANSNQAAQDRQAFARDIFLRLAVATGARVAYDPNRPDVPTAPTDSYYGKYVLPQPTGDPALPYLLTVTGYEDDTSTTRADYDALRWLAQLAANIVDYLDPDDVNTVFVWNPIDPTNPFNTAAGQNSYDSTSTGGAPSPLSQRVVFGTEKPGLVLNEVYAEIANDQTDAGRPAPNTAAQNAFEVRFFIELLNPANRDPDPPAGSIVHPGSRPTEVGSPPTPVADARGAVHLSYKDGGIGDITCYRVVITDNGDSAFTDLTGLRRNSGTPLDPPVAANPRGDIITFPDSVKAIADLSAPLTVADATEAMTNSNEMVEPNNGQQTGVLGEQAGRNGFAVIIPQYTTVTGDDAFTPDPATAGSLFKMALRKGISPPPTSNRNQQYSSAIPLDSLYYTTGPVGNTPGPLDQAQLTAWLEKYSAEPGGQKQKHAVLLQRLANPYIQFDANTNPYITVDYSTRVEVQDGARYVAGANNRTTPVRPLDQRFATGRVQPFAGDEGETQSPPLQDLGAATVAQSLTLPQSVAPADQPKSSFFSHNTPTPAAPANKFEWLTHLDRKLVSPAELLFVGATAPHQLTHRFGRPQLSGTPLYHRHDLQHRRPDLTMPESAAANPEGPLYASDGGTPGKVVSPLYRALEVLATKPWTVGIPYGGRQAGKVNVNMLWDESPQPTATPSGTGRSRVFDAVMDKAAGNAFTDTASTGDTAVIWAALKGSRSPGWVNNPTAPDGFEATGAAAAAGWVGATADENPTAGPGPVDRPIKGFGTALLGTAPTGPFVSVPVGGGLEDTLLRPRTVTSAVPGTDDNRPLFSTATPGGHPMQDHEPLRKALNSLTTVSDTYVLVLTVGFFEVREEATDSDGLARRVLGAEVYNDAPGDLRKQFMAVIDRTGLTARPGIDQAGNPRPFRNSVSPTGFTNTDDKWPWVLELGGPTLATGTPNVSSTRLLTPAPTAGTITATPDTDTTNYPGFVQVNPILTPAATPTFASIGVADNPAGTRFLYDGTPMAVSATWDNSTGTPRNSGTRFFVGTGENRELVEAYIDATSTWSYNATTGELKLLVRVIDPVSGTPAGAVQFLHVAGEAATNANFGNPGPQNKKYDAKKPETWDAVVRRVDELK